MTNDEADKRQDDPGSGERRTLGQRGLRYIPAGFWEKSGLWRLRRGVSESDYLAFLRADPAALSFCLLWIFGSGLGQTFFLSIFQPYWADELGLGTGPMGLLYGTATLGSGLLLQRLGRWVDHTVPGRVVFAAAFGLAGGFVLMALTVHWSMLLIAVFMMRFFGQGVSSMLGTTSAVRWYPRDQSKAVSVAGLGYPLGEAIFPWLLLLAVGLVGWRGTAWGVAMLALVLFLPVSFWLLRCSEVARRQSEAAARASKRAKRTASVFRDKLFLTILVVIVPQPFIGTGIIFFQTIIADDHGWPGGTFATGFLIFALTRAPCSIFAGAWADRIGPERLLGLPTAILGGGLLLLILPQPLAAYGYFACMGLCFGLSSAVVTPLFGKLFGVDRIGEVRGASASVAIFSTAMAPAVFGYALELGAQPTAVLAACAGILLLVSLPVGLTIRRRLIRKAVPGPM
ncbi:MAG: MFS transporter [Verrucomicrobia bacterium]|jgi:MFS family permease|nr:MFS transporter [Verrucomicrobiota bacterium]